MDLQYDPADYDFAMRLKNEVAAGCAIPFNIDLEQIFLIIRTSADYFWEYDDFSLEERYLAIKSGTIKSDGKNRLIKLPDQVMSVFGLHKVGGTLTGYSTLGDFSIERLMLSSFSSNYGGSSLGSGSTGGQSVARVQDMVGSMYELSTYNDAFSHPLSYNYSKFSKCLTILGEYHDENLVLQVFTRLPLQSLYNSHDFYRYCVSMLKLRWVKIYSMFDYKLPGGVTVRFGSYEAEASEELKEIKERIKANRAVDYFFVSGTV